MSDRVRQMKVTLESVEVTRVRCPCSDVSVKPNVLRSYGTSASVLFTALGADTFGRITAWYSDEGTGGVPLLGSFIVYVLWYHDN